MDQPISQSEEYLNSQSHIYIQQEPVAKPVASIVHPALPAHISVGVPLRFTSPRWSGSIPHSLRISAMARSSLHRPIASTTRPSTNLHLINHNNEACRIDTRAIDMSERSVISQDDKYGSTANHTGSVMSAVSPSRSSKISPCSMEENKVRSRSVPKGFWSQAHIHIARLIAVHRNTIGRHKLAKEQLKSFTTPSSATRDINHGVISPPNEQLKHIKEEVADVEVIDFTSRRSVPIVRLTDIQNRKRHSVPNSPDADNKVRHHYPRQQSIKIPKYDKTLPPENCSATKPDYQLHKPVVSMWSPFHQLRLQATPQTTSHPGDPISEQADVRMAMVAEYQARISMNNNLPTTTSSVGSAGMLTSNELPSNVLPSNVLLGNVLPSNVLPGNVLPGNVLTSKVISEHRKLKALQSMIQARRELERIEEEEIQSGLELSRRALRGRANQLQLSTEMSSATESQIASDDHLVIRPRTVVPNLRGTMRPPHPFMSPLSKPVRPPPSHDMSQFLINQNRILQRHLVKEKRRRFDANEALASALHHSKIPTFHSPLHGNSGELCVDSNGKPFIC